MSVLDPVRSVKVKLGLLVAASVVVASVVATIGSVGGVPVWLGLPVTVALALAVTQLLAVGMTSPLREMTLAARRMSSGDHAVRVTATSRDEVGQLARAFNSMAAELAAVDRHRRELVANVSHELRTPLAALRALLENLADGVARPDPQSLGAALDQAERLSDLVEELLDLARVDAGKAPLTEQPVDVAALLEAAVAESEVIGREVRYAVEVQPPDLRVSGDPARLRQLAANLLDNASRHSPPGGTVTVRATATADRWHLEVLDEGPGVGAADRERAFERFGTLTGTAGGGGTGLGLAIARWVTDLHGGTIAFLDPQPLAAGARVRADLPLVPPTRRPEEVLVPGPAAPTPPAPLSPPLSAPPQGPPVATTAPVSLTDAVFGSLWPERSLAGDVRVLGTAVAVGLLGGALLPFHDLGLATFVVLAAAGGALFAASRNRRDPFTLTCALLCLGLAATTLLRDADWIVVLCLLAGAGLCAVGLVAGRGVPAFLVALAAWPAAGLRGMPWLGRTLVTGFGGGAAVLRTLILSAVGLVVFALLFASADAVFAEWAGAVVPDLGSDELAVRVFLSVAVAGVVLAGSYLALNPPPVDRSSAPAPVARRFEWLAPVLVVDAVFVVFLLAQAAVVFGGHDYLERTTGLTYADYVHQGFGQLTVATALTLLVVWAASRKAPRRTAADRGWLRGSLGLLCALTLVVVASALHRMDLYQDAYGFTRLRLLVDVFEGWLGLLVVATAAAGTRLRAAWLPRFGLLSGVVLLLGLAALNPDARIAQENLDRFEATGKVDWRYLDGLSDDALPVLSALPRDLAECALSLDGRGLDDWRAWNLGRARADDFVDANAPTWRPRDACPGQTDD